MMLGRKRGRVVSIIQARMASTRLPGKVLADIAGKPMLVRVVERARRAESPDEVVVATTRERQDDGLEDLCRNQGIPVFRGAAQDVLDRYWEAAQEFEAAVIVRLTADCPLIDPGLIDQTVHAFRTAEPPVDFAANRLPWDRTFPIGLDVEVCSFEALGYAWREASEPHQREHVMPYLYENRDRFRVLHVRHENDLGHLRWTVDTPEDLVFVRAVYDRLGTDDFGWRDVLALIEREPELSRLNAGVPHRTHRDTA